MPSTARKEPATLDDLARKRDDGRAVELIDGEIVPKAMPSPEHGQAQAKLGGVLHGFNRGAGGPRGPGGWWIMTEVEVLYPRTEEVFRHDVVGFRRDLHQTRPRGTPVQARPDWVCEILSPSTARYDVVKKQRTLHAHGVPCYWIVDPEHQTLTVLRYNDEAYLQVLTAGIGDIVHPEPFAAEPLSIAEIFGEDE